MGLKTPSWKKLIVQKPCKGAREIQKDDHADEIRIRLKEACCETMENESIGQTGMGINYEGSQGQTERVVALQEEEEMNL